MKDDKPIKWGPMDDVKLEYQGVENEPQTLAFVQDPLNIDLQGLLELEGYLYSNYSIWRRIMVFVPLILFGKVRLPAHKGEGD
jgi:hypothetical protein